ncbi:hypothetical protein ACVBGC_18705 [Burkholderia stagnalis]
MRGLTILAQRFILTPTAVHYWNQPNFEGLLKLADAFDADADLKPLARYCRLREQGLRRDAFAALDAFLAAAHAFDAATARRVAIVILEADARTAEAHQFISQPLTARFLLPTLRAWMEDDAHANLPVRWLGLMTRDTVLLTRALAMCVTDVPVRRRLIGHALDSVDFSTHHLDESCFIGSVEHAMDSLERARGLIADAPDQAAFARVAEEVGYFDRLLADWRAWSAQPEGSFPDWCEKHGRRYAFSMKIYYRK